MNVLFNCAKRLVEHYIKSNHPLFVVCDEAHQLLGESIKLFCENNDKMVNVVVIDTEDLAIETFHTCVEIDVETLVLLEPSIFSKFHIYKWLDFSHGQPQIANLKQTSYVSVLPIESTYRVYSTHIIEDEVVKNSLMSSLEANTKYKITNPSGTELYFISRSWIDDGNEVLTAPIEDSINGVIAVDGALYFEKMHEVIFFYIEKGKLMKIEANSEAGLKLVKSYNAMTKYDYELEKNKQLAEIGIGYNTKAMISDCFMESEMMYGTCHFCFGNNFCYGGMNQSDFHGGSILITQPKFVKC